MTTPNLREFDWILVNTSSGKDSQTTLRQVTIHCKEQGAPLSRVVAVHADLGRVEWPGCPDLAGKQAEHYGIRLDIVKRTGGDLLDYVLKRGKWPSPGQRYCTSDFKRGPVRRKMTELTAALWDGSRPIRILNVMGMRAQESPFRSKMQPFVRDDRASNSKREVWNWLAIHEWPLEEVWSDIRHSGVPHHEAYDFGMPRLSCSFCIFSPEPALIVAARHRPELLADYIKVQEATGHKFRLDIDLVQIQKAAQDPSLAAPVVDDWRM